MPRRGFFPWLFFVLIKIGRAAAKLQPEEEGGGKKGKKEREKKKKIEQ